MPDRSAAVRREKMTTLKEAFLRGPLAIFHGTFTDIMWNAGRTPRDKSFCNNVYRAGGIPRCRSCRGGDGGGGDLCTDSENGLNV